MGEYLLCRFGSFLYILSTLSLSTIIQRRCHASQRQWSIFSGNTLNILYPHLLVYLLSWQPLPASFPIRVGGGNPWVFWIPSAHKFSRTPVYRFSSAFSTPFFSCILNFFLCMDFCGLFKNIYFVIQQLNIFVVTISCGNF